MPKKDLRDPKTSKTSTVDQKILGIIRKRKPVTVRNLVKEVQAISSLSRDEIIEHVINLHNQGKLILRNNSAAAPSTLSEYLFSRQAIWYWIIIAISITTTILVFTVPEDAYPIVYARYLLGSIFVLALPGYSFIKALFPTRELDNIERAALSIGLSLALVPITGLLLNYTPWGIRVTPVTLSLLALTVAFATAAVVREQQVRKIEDRHLSKLRGNKRTL